MKILMTGGTGLIGQAFIRQFEEHEFTVLSRSKPSHRAANALVPAAVKFIASLDQLQTLDGFDAVINLAGEPIIDKRWSPQQKHDSKRYL